MFPISKATWPDGIFPPAWFGNGIAYAAQEEDAKQWLLNYSSSARQFPNPLLLLTLQSYCLSEDPIYVFYLVRTYSAEEYFYTSNQICSTLCKINIPSFGLEIRQHLSHTTQLVIHTIYLVYCEL
jgi:hypothetical protein